MKKLVSNNLGLKISAILLSIFLWLFVTSRGQSEMSLEIPLEFKNIPVGLGIAVSSAKTGVVTIKGQERLMKNLKPSDLRVFVDLGKAKKGDGIYYVGKDDIKLPYAMSVMSISPSSLKIRIDETVEKPLLVRPSIVGAPEKGFYVKSIDVEPRSVIIQGLKTEVRKVNALTTEPLDITGANETVTQELNIDLAGINVHSDSGSVKVRVVIAGRKK
jgi:YbbR domain-containing protein